MQTQGEASNPLERNIELSVSREKVEAEVGVRLKRLAPKVKVQGFRPGKVPLKIVASNMITRLSMKFWENCCSSWCCAVNGGITVLQVFRSFEKFRRKRCNKL